ncbi:MAG: nuclear transport factor 2 family protein [Flavobacteriales bacterium]|nr:nuclear transport factor 2 family protein [Flavobacteriales bacterium]
MPFFDLTADMLTCVSEHDFSKLAEICDDDFGIIDINPEGGSEIIRDRSGWENWFKGLFSELKKRNAQTWSEITNYEAIKSEKMGYGVVDFDQIFIDGEHRLKFSVIATIIWKKVDGKWLESRYHSSLVKVNPL